MKQDLVTAFKHDPMPIIVVLVAVLITFFVNKRVGMMLAGVLLIMMVFAWWDVIDKWLTKG